MSRHIQEEIDQLRHDVAFLTQAVRRQEAELRLLHGRLRHCTSGCETSLTHLILALQAVRQLDPDRQLSQDLQ